MERQKKHDCGVTSILKPLVSTAPFVQDEVEMHQQSRFVVGVGVGVGVPTLHCETFHVPSKPWQMRGLRPRRKGLAARARAQSTYCISKTAVLPITCTSRPVYTVSLVAMLAILVCSLAANEKHWPRECS